MKNEKKNLLKFSIVLALLPVSAQSFATGLCTAGTSTQVASNESPYAFDCPQGKGVATFSGDAASYIKQFNTEIEEAGKAIAEQIAANSASEIKTITSGNEQLIKTLVDITNSSIKDGLTQDKAMLDMKMNYVTEMEERELKAKQSVMGMDDSREEVLFIISELKAVGNGSEGNYNHSQEVIAAMKAKYDDDPDFVMPIRIKSADTKMSGAEGCPDYNPEDHKAGKLDPSCFYYVKSSPGSKLEKYFQECSRVKREALSSVQSNVAKSVGASSQLKSQASYAKKASTQKGSQMAQAKVSEQFETSCTPTELNYGICGEDEDGNKMTSKEYLDKVIDNEIVPYGNLSSSNYLDPVSIGSIDGDVGEMTEEEIKSMRTLAQQSKTASGEVIPPDEVMSSNTPPLIKTYRTSAQYFAAEDYINNIVNREAMSGIPIEDTDNSDKSLFQSRFMSRSSSLSLAENSLRQPIIARTGADMATAIASGDVTREGYVDPETGAKSSVLKEDLNGASEYDRLAFSINKDYARISGDAKTAINNSGINGVKTASETTLDQYQIEALVRANQLLLKENETNERIELLLAAILANGVNSKDNVDYVNSFKYK